MMVIVRWYTYWLSLKIIFSFLGGGGGEISSFDLQRMWMDWAENMPKDFEGSMFNDPQ